MDNPACPELQPGNPEIPGATLVTVNNQSGVNFSVAAPEAIAVWLCLFDQDNQEVRLPMVRSEQGIWHGFVAGLGEGQAYGFRVDGPWEPASGHRFNPDKLLLDPVAREVRGNVAWQSPVYDYSVDGEGNWSRDSNNNADFVPRCIVRSRAFDWQGVSLPEIPVSEQIIYETHLKGFTRLHPDIPDALQGSYQGMCHSSVISYLKRLGINTVELLPVMAFASEPRLVQMGLSNYWGYNPLVFAAPEPSYAVNDPVTELKTMVRELHRAGIRVIMDVVFNHTCEGGNDGPSLCLRGLAAKEYYLLESPGNNGAMSYANYSGCGNTLNFDSPLMQQLTLHCLRLWCEEYHIDGFRFDLAPVLGRHREQFEREHPLFKAIEQDPLLSQRQMIAEPWDIGPDGYRLTGFPQHWQEWNDRYRDGVRSFWRGDNRQIVDLAWRMTGSVDLFGLQRPEGSINYICSHDGFTLSDLVSYTERRNLDNGEQNRDGDQHNLSWNCGAEGETEDAVVLGRRLQARKNLLATLLLSPGTPMLMAGDEWGNGQQGNNNAYCQDNPISWLDWNWLKQDSKRNHHNALHAYVVELMALRKQCQPFLSSVRKGAGGQPQLAVQWYGRNGNQLSAEMLPAESGHAFQVCYSHSGNNGQCLRILINNESQPVSFSFAEQGPQALWWRILSTADSDPFYREVLLFKGWYPVPARSVVVIREQSAR
ncbi:glycogen debranching protein GlgX [Spongorhabdus nitratireducens]